MQSQIMSEERLQHLAALYLANPILRRRGVLFETFIEYPTECLLAEHNPATEFLPLLPAQRRVRARLDAIEQLLDMEQLIRASGRYLCRNGAWFEPLHHHAFPRHAPVRAGREVEA